MEQKTRYEIDYPIDPSELKTLLCELCQHLLPAGGGLSGNLHRAASNRGSNGGQHGVGGGQGARGALREGDCFKGARQASCRVAYHGTRAAIRRQGKVTTGSPISLDPRPAGSCKETSIARRSTAEEPAEEVTTSAPDQFAALQKETSSENWDCEGAEAIPAALWAEARQIHRLITAKVRFPGRPFISPCGDGSIHISCTLKGGRQFVLEIKGPQVFWSRKISGGVWSSGQASNAYEGLRELRRFLGTCSR